MSPCFSRRWWLSWPLPLLCLLATGPVMQARAADEVLRLWGHGSRQKDYVGPLVARWAADFAHEHPGLRIEATLRGDSTAIGGLYTGAADLALMERAPIAIEIDGFKPIVGNEPFEVTVATGSLDRPHHAMAPVVFVHRDNPLQRLSLQQLDAILGADHKRGPANIRTWGELGLRGVWADRPIAVLTPELSSELPQFLQTAVLAGSQKWTPALREFAPGESHGALMAALARDPSAIAIACWPDRRPEARALALAADPAGPFVLPTRQTLQQRTYPLTRSVRLLMARPPQQALAAPVQAFVRHVLSAQGQRAIALDGGYLPLPDALRRQQLERLP